MRESARKSALVERNVTQIDWDEIISGFLSLSSSQDHSRTQVGKDFKEVMGVSCEVRPVTQAFIQLGLLILQDQVLNSES